VIIFIGYFLWPRAEAPTKKGIDVTIVDTFYSSNKDFTDRLTGFLSKIGLRFDLYKDADVSVEFYRKLPKYSGGMLLLRVHAGIFGRDPTSPTYLFTTEQYTAGKYFVEQLTEQVLSGVRNPEDQEEKPVFTVGPRFVAMSMEGNFNGSVVILSSCFGLYNSQLAGEFIKKGARVFISWDEKVSLYHTDRAVTLLVRALLEEGLPIREAVNKVMNELGEDPIYHSRLSYYPQEAGALRLKQ
jgi:hypothetical protein